MIDSVGDVATKDSKFETTLFQNNGDMKVSMFFGQKPGAERHFVDTTLYQYL